MKNKLIRLAAKVATVGMVVSMFAPSLPVSAATLVNKSDAMSRLKISEMADHEIAFTTVASIPVSGKIVVDFPAGFDVTLGLDYTDVDLKLATVEKTLAGSAGSGSGSAWGVTVVTGDGGSITLVNNDADTVGAGTLVEIEIGLNATGGDVQVDNPGTPNSKFIDVKTQSSLSADIDTGVIPVFIVNDDQVTVTASVSQTMSFDVDTNNSCAAANGTGDNAIDLGALSSTAVTTATELICIKLETNAAGGALVQVKDAYAGLLSVSPSKTIASSTATLSVGVEGYGLCIVSTNIDTTVPASVINEVAPFAAGGCAGTHEVGALTTSFVTMANTASGPADGKGYESIIAGLKASVASTTPASTLYADTLTFRATGTF